MKSRNNGFTLLELMIVVIIGGILTVLALPAFRTYIASSNLTQAANGALIALNTAREEAIKRNTYVRVDPVTCNGVASWAYGAFVWVPIIPTTDTPPAGANTAGSTLPLITGFPTASGDACTDGNKITATPSDATMTVCYNGLGLGGLERGRIRLYRVGRCGKYGAGCRNKRIHRQAFAIAQLTVKDRAATQRVVERSRFHPAQRRLPMRLTPARFH